jgi:zinc/manganese transport system permease protein
MNEMYDLLIAPFADYSFMKRALAACLVLSAGSAALGVLLVLRRMSLMGEAMSHAVLPGIALGFLFAGLSIPAMSIGGLLAGVVVALAAGLVTRFTQMKEDASFAAFYLLALALGVMLMSWRGNAIDLMHILFGSILAVDAHSLLLMASIMTVTLVTLAVIYRPLLVEAFDPAFLRSVRGWGGFYHMLFLVLVVLNLVAGFQALGTLMAVGLMILPAAAARFWSNEFWGLALVAILVGTVGSVAGLLVSYHLNMPSGPAIIFAIGVCYVLSLAFGPHGSIRSRYFVKRHLQV